MLGLLLLVTVAGSTRIWLPRPVPVNAADTTFSSGRAMSLLAEIAVVPRPTGSPEHERVGQLLVDRLAALGLVPEVQTTTSVIERPGYARAATVRNIIARVPGTAPTGTVLVTAHYDSREQSVGAGDDGSGVVAILEAVRAIRAAGPLRNDVVVLFTDGEELGLLGARAFVDRHSLMADVDLVLSFDMRGNSGPSIMFETNDFNGRVVRGMREWESSAYVNSAAVEFYRWMPTDTDFTPFREAGKQGLNFAAVGNPRVYHQAFDTPDKLSEATLQHQGLQALGALNHFGKADLRSVRAPDLVHFTVPALGMVTYPTTFAIPISIALAFLYGILLLLARRDGSRGFGILAGAGVSLLATGLAFVSGSSMLRVLTRFHAEAGALRGAAFHSEGWYMLALAMAVFALVVAAISLARRWLALVELTIGALALPTLAAIVAGFVLPFSAMNLQWPVTFALLSVASVTLLGERARARTGWFIATALALLVGLLTVPLFELAWIGLSFRAAGGLAAGAALVLFLCVPALEPLGRPNSWWAPVTALVVCSAAIGAGGAKSRPSPERPAPSTLVYAYDHGTRDAVWATAPDLGRRVSRGRAWAVERTSRTFDVSRDLGGFGYAFGAVPVAAAAVVEAELPLVSVVRDTILTGARHVVIRVSSRIDAELLQFHIDAQTSVHSVNGRLLTEPQDPRLLEHWGRPEGDVVLEFTMPPDAPIGVHIVEHLLRPEEVVGDSVFARPPDLAPNTARWSDRALFRYSVADLARARQETRDDWRAISRRPSLGRRQQRRIVALRCRRTHRTAGERCRFDSNTPGRSTSLRR